MEHGWTLQDLLAGMARRGEHPAIVTVRGGVMSPMPYADLAATACRLASGLLAAGLQRGEPVVLLAPNSADWIVARLAVGLAGALPAPLDDLGAHEEIVAAARLTGARFAFVSSAHAAAMRACLAPGSRLVLLDDAGNGTAGGEAWRSLLAAEAGPLPEADPQSPAILAFTSGTTGPPKSFTLSCRNIGANVEALAAARVIGPDDRVLLPLPLHHIYPQVVGLLTTLACGATIVLPEAVAGPQLTQALARAEVSAIVGVPRLYAALVDAVRSRMRAKGRAAAALFQGALRLAIAARRRFGVDLGGPLFRPVRARLGPRLRLLVSGGARLDPEILWALIGLGFEVRSGYGLTETASIFTGNLPGCERLGSEGRPFAGGEMRIAAPDETGTGEIELRGPSLFSGYRDNPEANRAAFTPDGWFRTGDLGSIDADGFLHVTGRVKEAIVLGGGKKVNPERLEAIYGDSPFIREIAVLEQGGVLVGLVHPDLEAIRAAGLTRMEDALRVTLQERAQALPPWERLAGFAVAAAPLPRTRLGKYRRFRLPALYEAARAGRPQPAPAPPSPEDEKLLARPRARAALKLLRERYPDRTPDLESSLALDLGIDSLEWMSLALDIERRFAITLPEAALARLDKVRDLVRLVAEAPSGEAPAGEAADIGRQLEPPGLLGDMVGRALWAVNRAVMRTIFRLRAAGLDNLPEAGPFVIVANHASDLDALVIAAALPRGWRSRIRWAGDAGRLFRGPLSRRLCRALRIFPVDERQPGRTLQLADAVLKRGEGLVWFPESWRSPNGELQRFLPGIGVLLDGRAVPVIPARLFGTFEALPRTRRWPRPSRLRIRFGAAEQPADLARSGEGEDAASRIAVALHAAVAGIDDVPAAR